MELLQILKFILVGVWNTGFDLVLFWVFLNLFGNIKSIQKLPIKIPALAHIGAFLIANSVSFLLNSMFTFSDSKVNRGFLPYLCVSVFSLIVSTFLIQYFTGKRYFELFKSLIGKHAVNEKQFALIVKLAVVSVVMVINFVGYKYIVYR